MSEPERRRPGRVRRWVVRPVVWGLLALVLLLAAVWFLIESPYAHRRAADLVIARASELLGRPIEVGSVDYNLARLSFELRNVVIPGPRPGDPDFARIPLVEVDFSWRDLRQRVLRLQQIDIVRPHVYLQLNPDGTSNLPELRTRRAAQSRFEVQVGRILVQDGVLLMNERRLPLQLEAREIWGRAIGREAGEGERIRLDAQVTAQDVVLDLPRAERYPFTASVRGSFVPGQVSFDVVRIAGPDLQARAEGFYRWQGEERRLELAVAADGWAQLANRLGYLEDPVRGPFDFRGRIERAGGRLTYSGTLRSPRLTALDGRVFEDVEAGLVGGREGLEIDIERAAHAGGTVEGVVTVDLQAEGRGEGEAGTPVELDLAFSRLRLQTLLADQFEGEVPVVGDLSGRVSGDAVYRFRTGAPAAGSGFADLHLDAVQEGTGLPISGDAPLAIEEGVISSNNIQLTAPSQTVLGTNFRYDLEAATGRFDFQLTSQDVGVLAPLLRGDAAEAAQAAETERPPVWLPSEGSGLAEGDVTISDRRFSARVRLDLQDVVSPVLTAETLQGAFEITPGAVEDLRLEATDAGGALMITGRVPLEEEGRRGPPEELRLAVDADRWPADGLLAFLAPGLSGREIRGRVSGRLDLGGTAEDLRGSSDLEVADLSVGGVEIGQIQGGISFAGQEVRIERGIVDTPAGPVLATGAFNTETGGLDLVLDAPSLSLAAEPFRGLTGGELTGRLSVAAVVGGTTQDPEAVVSLRTADLALQGRPLGEDGAAMAVAAWDGEDLRAAGSLLGLASFEGGGSLTLEQADLSFRMESSRLGALVRLAAQQPIPGDLSGALSGTVGLAADFSAGSWRAELVLAELRAEYEGHVIANREPVVVAATPERVTIESLYLAEPRTDTEIFVSGTVGLGETLPLDLRLQSTLPAVWAELAVPGIDVEGFLDVLAVVRGTVADPRLDGQGVIREARLLVPQFPHAFEDVEGVLLFNRDAVVLDTLRARVGGGTLLASGRVGLPGPGEEPEYRLQVAADDVSVRFPEPFLLRGDADLALVAAGPTRQIRGEVELERAFYLQDVQTDTVQLLFQALQRERLEVAETDELLANTHLNVLVTGEDALRVRNNVADLRGDIDLAIRGTLAQPVVFGEVEIDPGGTLIYADNEYEVERGLLTFTNPNRIDPVIDLVARTEVRNYDITLNLSGTLDRLDAQFASDEGLADLEVLALLFAGQAPGEGNPRVPGDTTPEAEVRAQSLLAGQAATLVSRRVGTLFGFDRFRIDPLATETGGALGGVQLTVGKRISRDLFVTYTTNPAASEEYLLRVEWQVARNVLLVFRRNGRNDTYAVEAEWEKRY